MQNIDNKKSLLKFTHGNAKLSKDTLIFNLPAGHSCPFARSCLSKANRITGKISDGKDAEYRCYAASSEAAFKNTRELLRRLDFEGKVKLIKESLDAFDLNKVKLIRLHESGDFFNQDCFDAWLAISASNPSKIFYAYTKSIQYWQTRMDVIPKNFKITGSFGGRDDAKIITHKLKSAAVVFSELEAREKNLKIDHDDQLAWKQNKSFAILLHGTQPKGSEAAKAIKTMKSEGTNFSYGKGNR